MFLFFFFNDTATTEIYTLSLHDALPIYLRGDARGFIEDQDDALALIMQAGERLGVGNRPGDEVGPPASVMAECGGDKRGDRKSTRLNSSHGYISYAVFCLKKKKNT